MSENYTSVNVELTEEHMEGLRHGSGSAFEFKTEEGHTLAVHVDRADKELDREWLLGEEEPGSSGLSAKQWKALAGIGLVLFAGFQTAGPMIDLYPMYTGGLIALLGGILIMEQIYHAEVSV